MANVDAGKIAGVALLVGGLAWFAWKIPKGREEWKPFFTAGLGLMAATLGGVIIFRKIPTAEVGWIDLTKEDEGTDESVNLKVTAAAESEADEISIGILADKPQWISESAGIIYGEVADTGDVIPIMHISNTSYDFLVNNKLPEGGEQWWSHPLRKEKGGTDDAMLSKNCARLLDMYRGRYKRCWFEPAGATSGRSFPPSTVRLGAEHRGRDLTPAAKKYVSDKISEIIRDWQKTGRIGSSRPKTLEQAQKQAVAVAYSYAKKAGHKIPKEKIHYM